MELFMSCITLLFFPLFQSIYLYCLLFNIVGRLFKNVALVKCFKYVQDIEKSAVGEKKIHAVFFMLTSLNTFSLTKWGTCHHHSYSHGYHSQHMLDVIPIRSQYHVFPQDERTHTNEQTSQTKSQPQSLYNCTGVKNVCASHRTPRQGVLLSCCVLRRFLID